MKRVVLSLLLLFFIARQASSQITSPVIRGNFGVDADLRANYFNGALQAGNDDWYNQTGTPGTGQFVIDTTGAAAIVARYATDIPFRRTTFVRTMRYPAYSIINNRVLLDAILVRDYHGDDSTVFASGSNKNGDNPLAWTTPVSQGIPDKNDILDMLVHVRRAGPNGTDSLWLMGGLSLDNTTGNRYLDFEMFQTDFYYNRSTLSFSGAGPDEGHTSWQFDAAGNIVKAGDIIFSAEYQSSSLSSIEARIWVPRSATLTTPAPFNWGGAFDGASASSNYGYASIVPKTAGAYYTGLQCGNNTWGGPFAIILQDDAIATDYSARQFVELSVNLSKLGLDPLTTLGGDPCGMPFKSIIVKTRASASFTAELKDFVAPFSFFFTPAAELETETPYICAEGSVAEIHVRNPLSTSTYLWTTTNGNIVGPATGTSIYVDTPGVYIVTQYLLSDCAPFARDTIEVLPFAPCDVLTASLMGLQGILRQETARLSWKVLNNGSAAYFEIERSTDGVNFITAGRINNDRRNEVLASYVYNDFTGKPEQSQVYYRVKMVNIDNSFKYSNTILLTLEKLKTGVVFYPNPATDALLMQVNTKENTTVRLEIFDAGGKQVLCRTRALQQGSNTINIDGLAGNVPGLYIARVYIGNEIFTQKILLAR